MSLKLFLVIVFGSIATSAQMNMARSCVSNLGLIPDGTSVTGYPNPKASMGQSCQTVTIICHDGRLSGPDLFPTCNTSVNQSCGNTPDGGVLYGYLSSKAPCILTSVSCANGQLTGPAPHKVCSN